MLNLPKKQERICLCVKPKENFKGDLLRLVQNQVASKTQDEVLKISKANNGSVFFKCSSNKDSEMIQNTINSEYKDALTVE